MGLEDCNAVEIVHLYALKQFLSVSVRTPNTMVYGDTGLYLLPICATLRTIKYWIRVLKMEEVQITV